MNKVFKVEGMSCGHCEARVKNALAEINGITIIKVSASEDMAEIEAADESLILAAKEAIEDAGYDVIE